MTSESQLIHIFEGSHITKMELVKNIQQVGGWVVMVWA